ncbi:glycoside hydrolase family 32 protein [Pseudarthrobacter sp. NamB4]|uniref:glycoside hydrolase family 32 protein n=1 Tax=Pseudarthrobacter sp. NamB4 TaxID=2576837 RepID=UPI0010FE81E0|nr:glycoside hydrolase family 32 protein [Pseudarthrobacter sp. NamB4]TLM74989.1 glycoside hydrolase family 32 protein [Pseudarthrobacter sp. NamB4]
MPQNSGTVLPALKELQPTRRPLLWVVAGVLAALVLVVSLLPGGNPRQGADAAAGRVLGEVASAQAAAKDRSGSYATLWLKGADDTLAERGGNLRLEGAKDVRSIECGNGWLAGARVDGKVFLRSSLASDVTEETAAVQLPDCISSEARDALLADLGLRNTWPKPDAASFEPPADKYRPAYHLTPDQRWMNDPQRPFFLDGQWHYYYLYNADYPEGNGTEWFHATSTDLVHWKNEGVAVEKFRNGLGDIETGSAVVDTEGTAGFGKGAVIAVLTQQHDGVQRQSVFYSTDNGYSFRNHEQNPVMENPGEEHWRDPRIVRDEANNQWLMLLAEGHKIGFYTSPDLKKWTYVSAFERDGLGILECPDFFQIDVDGDPGKRTWVLAASANGSGEGRTTGLAYWTGSFDGESFTPDGGHQWLDGGADFYAAVTWDDPRLTDGQRKASRHAIGWMNNWAYARQLPTEGWSGAASIVRDIRLVSEGGRAALVSSPTPALQSLEGTPEQVPAGTLQDGSGDGPGAGPGQVLPVPDSGAYKVQLQLEKPASGSGEARMLLHSGGKAYATVGYDFGTGKAFLVRDGDAVARGAPGGAGVDGAYRQVRTADIGSGNSTVNLTVYVDRSSVEVFADGGRETLTSLVFPPDGVKDVRLASAGGPVSLRSGTVTPLAAIR